MQMVESLLTAEEEDVEGAEAEEELAIYAGRTLSQDADGGK